MSNLNMKLSDDVVAFVSSSTWAVVKFRYLEYKSRLVSHIGPCIRQKDWSTVSLLQGKLDAIDEVINLTENLAREIKLGELDVDAALSVIENKTR